MNRILATVIAICFLGNTVIADEIEGNFSCKVLSTSVTSVEEGKVKKYNGYKDGMAAGDELVIEYSFETSLDPYVSFKVRSPNINIRFAGFNGSFEAPDKHFSTINPNSYYTKNERVFLNPDGIELEFASDDIRLERYYKDDWQSSVVRLFGTSVFVATLDCRHPRNSLDKIIDYLREEFED